MTCVYCKGGVTPLGKLNDLRADGTTVVTQYFHCRGCKLYMHYEDEYLMDYEVVDIMCPKGKFIYKVYPRESKVEVFGYDEDVNAALTHLVFTLDHVPNWNPNNLPEKINTFVIFS